MAKAILYPHAPSPMPGFEEKSRPGGRAGNYHQLRMEECDGYRRRTGFTPARGLKSWVRSLCPSHNGRATPNHLKGKYIQHLSSC
jgi:hypothetical protein